MKYGMPRQQLMILSQTYKGHHITFKKYHETGHMLTVAYQPNHRYRKDWRLLMRESKDSWLATIHFFDRHLKKK